MEGTYISSHDLQHRRLDVIVSDTLYVPVSAFLVPNLKRLTANAVQDREETALKSSEKDAT